MRFVKTPTGTWIPAWVPESKLIIAIILLTAAMVESATGGFDGSLLNGLNILPVYTGYFNLTAATSGLNTSSVFIGKALSLWCAGWLNDKLGRRPTLFWASILSIIGIIIQSAAQNIGMFVAGRAILGAGSSWAGVASAVYLTETFSAEWRPWGVGILNNFYYVGALIAAGVTLGTAKWQSTWAWRAPCLFQALFAAICLILLPFIPESPRWLIAQGLNEEGHIVLAQTNASGDLYDPVVMTQYKEIVDTLKWEQEHESSKLSWKELVRNPVARRRLFVGSSPGWMSCIPGNVISSYYLGAELTQAGITDATQKLDANVVLNVWCLATCLFGTSLAVKWGRKPTALLCQAFITICLFLVGGLTKVIQDNPENISLSLSYADVACIFLFQGGYSIAWTPLMTLYPPEVLNYSIRSHGYAIKQYTNAIPAIILTYVMPIGLKNLGWKMYIINASWDVATFFIIWFTWVETKGYSLEEIDAIFEGKKHSDAPDLEKVMRGEITVDVAAMEKQMADERTYENTDRKSGDGGGVNVLPVA